MDKGQQVELFKELLKDSVFVDNIEETDYGLKYLFDGFLTCAVIFEGDDRFCDAQDINTDELPLQHPDLDTFVRYSSIDQIALRILELESEGVEVDDGPYDEIEPEEPWTDEDEAALEEHEEQKRRRIAEENEY